jgi:hypothetical protein
LLDAVDSPPACSPPQGRLRLVAVPGVTLSGNMRIDGTPPRRRRLRGCVAHEDRLPASVCQPALRMTLQFSASILGTQGEIECVVSTDLRL